MIGCLRKFEFFNKRWMKTGNDGGSGNVRWLVFPIKWHTGE